MHYDHEALLGILVLEAQRAGAVVIGEDLGVVAPHVRDYMTERGVSHSSGVTRCMRQLSFQLVSPMASPRIERCATSR